MPLTAPPQERAILVGVEFTARPPIAPGPLQFGLDEAMAELGDLATGAGAAVVDTLVQRRPAPDPASFIGRGKLEELKRNVAASGADLVIFDAELSATQQRNLERATEVRVIDRTQMILDTFARHARTREGQLQVELAQLEYLLPRLAGRGLALSRLGGGIGTRGPGETQLESDRRRIHQRIRGLRTALEDVRRHRQQQRQKREAVPLTTVALVGYTNAGKSSLFNRLTNAGVLISPRMFATLDPTIRALDLPSHRRLLLSDTVGFLRNLPHGLISAFRATLEEVQRASLLLHVFDVASPHRDEYIHQVRRVLAELGVEQTPEIMVANKTDLLPGAEATPPPPGTIPNDAAALRSLDDQAVVAVSAKTGAGLDALLRVLDERLPLDPLRQVRLLLPHSAGKLLHLVHERGQVLHEQHGGEGVALEARVPASLLRQLEPFLL